MNYGEAGSRNGAQRPEDLVQEGRSHPGVGGLKAEEDLGHLEDVEDDEVLLLDDAADDDDRKLQQREQVIAQSGKNKCRPILVQGLRRDF